MLEAVQLRCPALRSFRCPTSPNICSLSVTDAPLEPATRRHIQFLRLSVKEKEKQGSSASHESGEESVVPAVLTHIAQLLPDFVPALANLLRTIPRSVTMYATKRKSEQS